jgi:glycine cleavage system H protein
MSGKVVEINGNLDADPAAVNREPYGAGWLFKLKLSNPDEAKSLLGAAAYEKISAD